MAEAPIAPPQQATLLWTARCHYDVVNLLNYSFRSGGTLPVAGFATLSEHETAVRPADYIEETGLRSSLAVLTLIDAAFKVDYRYRCENKLKDDLSRAFRATHKRRRSYQNVNLEQDIFDAWLKYASGARALICELRSAFRFRHWLAHGRYWTPKLGRNYDFNSLYSLADAVFCSLPLCGMGEA